MTNKTRVLNNINVLSLFDGMSCGMLALQRADITVKNYDAYEIDKYAIQVSKHNFPNIKQHGDVFNTDYKQYENIDILMGGGVLVLIGQLHNEKIVKPKPVVSDGICFNNT